MKNKESKIILNWMPLDAESEIEYTLRSGLVRTNYKYVGGGASVAIVMAVDYSICSSILTLQPPLLRKRLNTCLYTVALFHYYRSLNIILIK